MKGRRIAILDDHADTAEGLRRLFAMEGAEPVIAGTIAEAEAVVAAGPPSLFLIDVGMPDGSGLDFLRRLKSDHPEVEALVATGHSDPGTIDAALAAGARAVLVKPLTVAVVKRALDSPPIARALDIAPDPDPLP